MSCCGNCQKDRHMEEGHDSHCCGGNHLPKYGVILSVIVYDENERNILLFKQGYAGLNTLFSVILESERNVEEMVTESLQNMTNLEVVSIQFNSSLVVAEEQMLLMNFVCRIKDSTALINDDYGPMAEWFAPILAKESLETNSISQYFLERWLDKQGFIDKVED